MHDYYAEYFRDYRWGLFPSYVNPNANCPVCRAAVYFYQSPYGGRVYFDELGPPWPKHPCTDSTRFSLPKPVSRRVHPLGITSIEEKLAEPVRFKWFSEGWLPFVTETAILEGMKLVLDGYILQQTGKKQIKITCSMGANRYYEVLASGVSIGFNFLMNSSRIIDAFREGLVMIRYKTETSIEIDIIFMTHLHEIKRYSIE